MKRTAIVLFVLSLFAGIVLAGPWKNYEDYQAYKTARTAAMEAQAAGDTFNAVANFTKAEDFAEKSADGTIKGWPINNAAYTLITQFKTAVGYAEKLAKLEAMKPSKEKLAYQKELADLFNLQLPLLDEAKGLLEKGKGLGEEVTASKTIQSNLDFISWVSEFTTTNLNGSTTEAKPPEQAADTKVEKKIEAVKAADVKVEKAAEEKTEKK